MRSGKREVPGGTWAPAGRQSPSSSRWKASAALAQAARPRISPTRAAARAMARILGRGVPTAGPKAGFGVLVDSTAGRALPMHAGRPAERPWGARPSAARSAANEGNESRRSPPSRTLVGCRGGTAAMQGASGGNGRALARRATAVPLTPAPAANCPLAAPTMDPAMQDRCAAGAVALAREPSLVAEALPPLLTPPLRCPHAATRRCTCPTPRRARSTRRSARTM